MVAAFTAVVNRWSFIAWPVHIVNEATFRTLSASLGTTAVDTLRYTHAPLVSLYVRLKCHCTPRHLMNCVNIELT